MKRGGIRHFLGLGVVTSLLAGWPLLAQTPLPVNGGGTGQASFTQGFILFGAGTNPLLSDPNLFWDNANKRLGIGTATPTFPVHIVRTAALDGSGVKLTSSYGTTTGDTCVGDFGAYGSILSNNRDPNNGAFQNIAAPPNQFKAVSLGIGGYPLANMFSVSNYPAGTMTARLVVDWNGNVGIGTAVPQAKLHVAGSGRFDGTVTGTNIQAQYQDVAEWVPSSGELPAGTVVVIDGNRSNAILPSSAAYDTRIAGVVTDRPGVLLGEAGEGKTKVATTGRVKVRATAANGAIRMGDLLVTSNLPGLAMKSLPARLAGLEIHRPGTLIGKALEPLAEGEGEILVLLSLQ